MIFRLCPRCAETLNVDLSAAENSPQQKHYFSCLSNVCYKLQSPTASISQPWKEKKMPKSLHIQWLYNSKVSPQRHTHTMSYLARCDNISFHWTPEWTDSESVVHLKSDPLQLHMEVLLFFLQSWQENQSIETFSFSLPMFHSFLQHTSCYFDIDCVTIFAQAECRKPLCVFQMCRNNLV